jgi:quinol monooxygenase YgiN
VVRLNVALAPAPGTAAQILSALRFLMARTRLEDGCLECAAWTVGEATVQYVEEWRDEPTLRQRVRSDAFTSLLAVMEAAATPPHIQFDFVAATRGLDYIVEVRECEDR